MSLLNYIFWSTTFFFYCIPDFRNPLDKKNVFAYWNMRSVSRLMSQGLMIIRIFQYSLKICWFIIYLHKKNSNRSRCQTKRLSKKSRLMEKSKKSGWYLNKRDMRGARSVWATVTFRSNDKFAAIVIDCRFFSTPKVFILSNNVNVPLEYLGVNYVKKCWLAGDIARSRNKELIFDEVSRWVRSEIWRVGCPRSMDACNCDKRRN